MTDTAPGAMSGLACDLLFLAVAGDDELGALGFGYDRVRMTTVDAGDRVPEGDLVLRWSEPEPAQWGRTVRRLSLSVSGGRRPAVVAAALERAGRVLRDAPPPVVDVRPSAPHVQLAVDGRVVTTRYDVLTRF